MSPQEQFLKFHKDDAAKLREESQRGWFMTSLTYAQSAVVDRGATIEEINGMNRLIESLKQLAADKPEIKRLPIKSLAVLDGTQTAGDEQPETKPAKK